LRGLGLAARPVDFWQDPHAIRADLFGTERMEHHAISLATEHRVALVRGSGRALSRRLKDNAAALLAAYLVTKWGIMHQKQWAIGTGFWFLLGGTMMVFSLPTPLWFALVDLGLAYVPMGYLGYYLGKKY
jgi:hypothetical protein